MMFSQRVQESSVQFVEAVDERRLAGGRRKERRGLLAVDVEGEAHGDTSLLCVDHGAGDDLRRRLEQVEVVEGEVETRARSAEEPGQALGHLDRRLPSVGEHVRLDHEA